MAGDPSAQGGPHFSAAVLRRFPALRWVSRIDDAIFGVERAFVTASMVVMSAAACTTVLYQFLAKQRAVWNRIGEDASIAATWPTAFVIGAIALLTSAAFSRTPACKNNPTVARILAAALTTLFVAYCAALLWLPSNLVMAATVLAGGLWVAVAELDAPRPIPPSGKDVGRTRRVATTLTLVIIATIATFSWVPPLYSWTTKIALFLLLWSAFVGASMATYTGSHLKIDAVRKAVPRKLLPYYEAASYSVASAFTAGFTYLAWLYFKGRLPELPAPGEIPDWLKVLAIPIALALVTLRFAGKAAVAGLYGLLGLSDDAATEGQQ